MKRYKLTLDGNRYDLSQHQLLMLSRKTRKLTDPMDWNTEQRVKSLVKQGLGRKRNGHLERTKLGFEVWQKIANRHLRRNPIVVTVEPKGVA
jgi:hypothetical protein